MNRNPVPVLESDMREYAVTYNKYPTHHNRTVYVRATSEEKAEAWGRWYLGFEPDTLAVREVVG